MDLRPLKLSDRTLLEPLLQARQSFFSEYSFSNLYLFREVHNPCFDESQPSLILFTTRDNKRLAIPLKPIEVLDLEKIKSLAEGLFPLTHDEIMRVSGFSIACQSEDSDYIFKRDEIETYSGRHRDGVRWNLKKFLEMGTAAYCSITEVTLPRAKLLLNKWKESHKGADDFESCLEALELLKILKMEGWIFSLNGQDIGFALGEYLREDIFLLSFVKALHSTPSSFPYIYQTVARVLPASVKWLNWEQDLGIEALKKAKSSYHPYKKEEKWRVLF